jgi:HTH-type transcriptional regulator / antitoxin HigA
MEKEMKSLTKSGKNPTRASASGTFENIADAWEKFQSVARVTAVRNTKEYNAAIEMINHLVDIVGNDESHPLAELLDIVGTLVERYEDQEVIIRKASPCETLAYLIDEHALTQADLRNEVGSQGVVSEVLSGKRKINVRQAKALATRFGVSPTVFL